ncbi:MAG TPA: HAMP domain-containing sensor histidine kinase [Bacteroidales bacterium]|nr:HAMP domain-containing sensor histidine kinase [Bacteroidales bacterium]
MRKKMLYTMIGLICLSALGIVAIQLLWIRNAWKVKEAQFDRSVNEALGSVVNKLETQENLTFITRNYKQDSIRLVLQAFVNDTLSDWQKKLAALTSGEAGPKPPPPPKPVAMQRDTRAPGNRGKNKKDPKSPGQYSFRDQNEEELQQEQENQLNLIEQMSREFPGKVDTFTYTLPSEYGDFEYRIVIGSQDDRQPFAFMNPQPGTGPRTIVNIADPSLFPPGPDGSGIRDQLDKLNKKTRKVQEIIRKIAIDLETQPKAVKKRIDQQFLGTALKESLTDRDIRIPFEFAVISPGNDSVPIPIRTGGFRPEWMSTGHRVSLFPNDLVRKPEQLLVYFPDEKSQVLRSVSWMMAGSSLFILFILLTSGLSIYFMIRQKRISDIKTDFINNMTHEFKTPIATISIAADSIGNPKVIGNPDSVRNYTRIIKEENSRMNARVEQVLQMALLDSRDFSLHKKATDVHELLSRLAGNIRIQAEQREGTLVTKFFATRSEVKADESHLANVFLALFDNAIKYSGDKPEISVETYNAPDTIRIIFRDHGIGMTPEVQQRIFDKFYRVTHGNIHNVKGFGLGLSYAKAILMAHGGTISVESRPGQGSSFEVTLPLYSTGSLRIQ